MSRWIRCRWLRALAPYVSVHFGTSTGSGWRPMPNAGLWIRRTDEQCCLISKSCDSVSVVTSPFAPRRFPFNLPYLPCGCSSSSRDSRILCSPRRPCKGHIHLHVHTTCAQTVTSSFRLVYICIGVCGIHKSPRRRSPQEMPILVSVV